MERIYVVDTDFLIALTSRYSPTAHISYWKRLVELQRAKRMVTHRHVRLEYDHDSTRKVVFESMKVYDFDDRMMEIYVQIVKENEKRWKWEPKTPVADQAVVALAAYLNSAEKDGWESGPAMILSNEVPCSPESPHWKIPNICKHYGVTCQRQADLAVLEDWVL